MTDAVLLHSAQSIWYYYRVYVMSR